MGFGDSLNGRPRDFEAEQPAVHLIYIFFFFLLFFNLIQIENNKDPMAEQSTGTPTKLTINHQRKPKMSTFAKQWMG